jgi:hypothetical protein
LGRSAHGDPRPVTEDVRPHGLPADRRPGAANDSSDGITRPGRIQGGWEHLFNEDDHYGFETSWNNFVAATSAHASWGFFDFRRQGEGLDEGYQSVPVAWGISSARKRGFFNLLQEMTGGR